MRKSIATQFIVIFSLFLLLGLNVLPVWAQSAGGVAAVTDEAVLNAPAAAEGIELTPTQAEKSAVPGSLVTYQLAVKNTGNDEIAVMIQVSDNLWQSVLNKTNLTLAAGQSEQFALHVTVPTNAASGASDTATVLITLADGTAVSAALTTKAQTSPPPGVNRPLVVMQSYSAGSDAIVAGQEFDMVVRLLNDGQSTASNLIVVFESAEFLPRDTGGVRAVASLAAGKSTEVRQPLLASSSLAGTNIAKVSVKLTYNDPAGASYSETFTLTVNLRSASYGSGAYATVTPTGVQRPRLVVDAYSTDVDPLQPGSQFTLDLEVRNLGNTAAKSVTMVLGGGASVDVSSGTPQPGGGSGDLTNFAPLGSSNLIFLGDIETGAVKSIRQQLIVNVTTNPGAYPLKLSFVYNDGKNINLIDDQVITLLVYALPQVEVSFYRDPGTFFVNQPNLLPLQVTNLGRKTAVLGNLRVTAQEAEISNNVMLVGNLEPGGYFTLDAMALPFNSGALEITVTINYTDDFNQPRTIIQMLVVDVAEAELLETPFPGSEMGAEMMPELGAETFWQKVVRFLKGLIGLDSAPPQPEFPPLEMPPDGMVPDEFEYREVLPGQVKPQG